MDPRTVSQFSSLLYCVFTRVFLLAHAFLEHGVRDDLENPFIEFVTTSIFHGIANSLHVVDGNTQLFHTRHLCFATIESNLGDESDVERIDVDQPGFESGSSSDITSSISELEDGVGEVVMCNEFASSAVEVELPWKAVATCEQDLVSRALVFGVFE